jgi:hypothetical protein
MGNKCSPQLLTIGEVAWRARRSVEWVRKHADAGDLPHSRDSAGRRLFDQRAVDAALRLAGQSVA